MNGFPDFGKELDRPFEVDERCYDCAELYHGCNARPENPDSHCADYLRMPDAGVNGQTGQEIPPSRMGNRKEPRIRSAAGAPVRAQTQLENPPSHRPARVKPEPVEQPAESDRQPDPEPQAPTPSATEATISQPDPPANPKARICGCGTVLPKGRRLCDTCRTESRRQTKRRYMRSYMEDRRSGVVGSDSGARATHATTHAVHALACDLLPMGQSDGGVLENQTSVLTNA